ncbi:unnamed protein product [Penicillium egyptiacum]|uniref:Uncharacterized protein n=1 Tax=Penicillium egyptiacum TaxID=1303716 RepID=A0A9W4K2P9_9EURO|nr:unnamed protein product [Penicillium egyptiacum]
MATEEENELFEIISSYSEPHDYEEQASISEHLEGDISEISEDGAFVVSDGDQSPYSNRPSESSNYSQHCHHRHDDDFSNPIGHKIPISTIAKRVIHQNDSPVVQYLVLWRSWELEKPHMSGMAEKI